MYVTIPSRVPIPFIIKFFKDYLSPNQLYAIYFRHENLSRIFSVTAQTYFKNASFKLLHCTNMLEDIQGENDQKEKIEIYHTTKTCHRGINETRMALSRRFYWPRMSDDVTDYINNCEVCQKNKYDRSPPVIKFNLTPTASRPFEHIHVDTFKINHNMYLTIIQRSKIHSPDTVKHILYRV